MFRITFMVKIDHECSEYIFFTCLALENFRNAVVVAMKFIPRPLLYT